MIGAPAMARAARTPVDAGLLAALPLPLMVAAAAGVTTWLAWRPVEYLVTHNVSDDAFYYFQTARTLVGGGGVSVDGEVWANGFHPLWLLMLLPIYALGASDETAIHIALTISGVAVALSGVALYATARRLGISHLASLLAAGLYLSHPVVLYMAVNGLETGINLAAFVVLLYLFVRCWQDGAHRDQLCVSAAAGIVVLTRTDYAITACLLLAALCVHAHADRRSLLALAAPAVLLTAPWFVWNLAVFGSPLQSSAGALPYVEHQLFPAPDASFVEIVRHAVAGLRYQAFDVLPYMYLTPRLGQAAYGVLGLGALVAATVALAAVARDRVRMAALALLSLPAIGITAQLLVHALLRWYVREWYLVAIFPLLALMVGLLVDLLWQRRAGAAASAAVLALIVGSIAMKSRTTYGDGWYGLQIDMLTAARWLDAETPPDARVGAFNSGIVGYFSHRTTVNLDGVMNPDALDAIRERRVSSYAGERRIGYIADFQFYPFWFYRPFLGADLPASEIARFDTATTLQGPFVIYRLDSSAAPPRAEVTPPPAKGSAPAAAR